MLRKSVWIPIVILFFAVVGCGLFYRRQISKQEPVKVYKPVEVQQSATPKSPPPGETAESGHWHGDVWHAEPYASHVPAKVSKQPPLVSAGEAGQTAESTPVLPQTPKEIPPDFVNPTSTSSNPLFADGVPEHLQCPPEFIDVYRRENEDNFIRKLMLIYYEIQEKWNPNRPIAEVWPVFIEVEKWYRENADPQRAELFGAAGRTDWLVQHWLDYPEITVLLDEDLPRASDMLRVEIGLFSPDWNAFTLPDGSGRTFRTDVEKKYVFTWSSHREKPDGGVTSRTTTYTTGPSNGNPNPEVIEIDLDTISDEELEALQGWDYNINPYTTGAYKLGD